LRRSKSEKAETHSKIVSVAAKRFRELGLDGIGVGDVMKEAGSSVGGFYKHFKSRDALVIEALAEAFKDLDRWEEGAEDLPALLRFYLGEQHCDCPGEGCAITALAGDVRHASSGIRTVFTQRVKHSLGYSADRLEHGDKESRRSRAILLLSAGIGGLALARAVNDKALSREILASLREQLIGIAKQPAVNHRAQKQRDTTRPKRKSSGRSL
jgi:TetR/AcrR family transcriptional regulator, transcriptional repressor for nem operon